MIIDIAKLRQALEDTPEVYGEGLDPDTRAGLLAALDEVEKLRWYRDDFLAMATVLQDAIKEFDIDVPAGRKVAEVIVDELRRHVRD